MLGLSSQIFLVAESDGGAAPHGDAHAVQLAQQTIVNAYKITSCLFCQSDVSSIGGSYAACVQVFGALSSLGQIDRNLSTNVAQEELQVLPLG